MKTTIILILFMFSFNCLMAVPVQIKGKVQEKGTGNPIEFADVVLTKKGETDPASFTHTKENGDFHLSGIAKGEYSLMVRLIGYDIYTQGAISITSSESVTDLGIIELQPLEVGIAEVVVQAAKKASHLQAGQKDYRRFEQSHEQRRNGGRYSGKYSLRPGRCGW